MGFERNYQIKIHSSQLKRKFSISTKIHSNLHSWFVIGLIDGEGTFSTSIIKNTKYKSGWTVKIWFQITLHSKDYSLLLELQKFFGGVGSVINKKTQPAVTYSVASIKDLTTIIIPHF